MTSYALGVDLGTTWTAAAIGRGTQADPLPLGTDTAAIPSVVFLRDDGEVLVGDAAERRSSADPARAAREFKRRLGDPVPVIVGGTERPVERLMADVLAEVVRRATEQEGEPPAVLVLTHPANWGSFKVDLLREVARLAGVDSTTVTTLAEPEAAAVTYTRLRPVEVGELIAVYDFGGGTFDAAVVRRTPVGFELIGTPEGLERLGGIDIDQAVLALVDRSLDGRVSGADRRDPQTLPAQARLRVDCRRAKEALSSDADTQIVVTLPGVHAEVRLTRQELDAMVRPRLEDTIRALERTVASSGTPMSAVSRVLLVGGTSRLPLVAEMVRSATGRPVALDAHPKRAIALGAALVGAAQVASSAADDVRVATTAAWQPPVRVVDDAVRSTRGSRRPMVIAGVTAVVTGAVVAGVLLLGGRDDVASGTPEGTRSAADRPASPANTAFDPPASDRAVTIAPDASAPAPAVVGEVVAELTGVVAVATGSAGPVAVTDSGEVVRLDAGAPTLLTKLDGRAGGLVALADGSYAVTVGDDVIRVPADGGAATLVLDGASVAMGTTPGPIAVDGAGNLYVTDLDNRRIGRRGTDGGLSLVAGNGDVASGTPEDDARPATSVAIGAVGGLDVDGGGNLVFADAGSGSIRAVAPDGTLSTRASGLGDITAMTVDPSGRVFLAGGGIAGVGLLGSGGNVEPVAGTSELAAPIVGLGWDTGLLVADGSRVRRVGP
ncbi:MAG: Hsp70 family protein [Actinomycetes bacterium]